MNPWRDCKKILCVRPDNMGDLLMSAPAIAALKETLDCKITILTSSLAKDVARHIPAIDETLVWDAPWVKNNVNSGYESLQKLVETLRHKNFDGAVIFTVFSQNPLPAALLLAMAQIPRRLAYCRENPYQLLSDWVPEKEPYHSMRHQVRRDLDLVRSIGAVTSNERITIHVNEDQINTVNKKLMKSGVDLSRPWLIMHPGASDIKRAYPTDLWIETGKRVVRELDHQVIITGVQSEATLAKKMQEGIGEHAYNLGGLLTLEEYISLIKLSPLLISVNTGSIHLASAVKTRMIVLYALTNPQHAPWQSIGKILPFSIPEHLQSRNEVLRYVQENIFEGKLRRVKPDEIIEAAFDLLVNKATPVIPELILP